MNFDLALQTITISGGYDPETKKPQVFIGFGASEDEVGISPEDADRLGHLLIAASQIALLEADMLRFLNERMDVPLQLRKVILSDFRSWRISQKEGADDGSGRNLDRSG